MASVNGVGTNALSFKFPHGFYVVNSVAFVVGQRGSLPGQIFRINNYSCYV